MRGRGGRDFQADGRGRGRPFHPDDRDRHHDSRDRMPDRSYRPRSRSREPLRRERDPRDDRDFDRRDRDDRRFIPREYDSYIGPAGPKPGPRALDTHRGSASIDSRHLPGTPTGAVPHTAHHSPADRLGPPVDPYTRRPSVATDSAAAKDGRREPGRDDLLLASRAEASRERYAPRASSPPAAVPAFGSNVWRNPMLDVKPSSVPQPPKTSAPPAPPAPPAPVASASPAPLPAQTIPSVAKPTIPTGLSTAPPTGPKAERVSDRHPLDHQNQSQGPNLMQENRPPLAEQARLEPRPAGGPTPPNVGPPSSSVAKSSPTANPAPLSAPLAPSGPPVSSRPPPTGPQSTLRANVSPSFPRPARLPYTNVSRDASPGAMQPTMGARSTSGSGPSSGINNNTSPKSLPANIPTGPKADRNNPMAARPSMYPPSDRPGFSGSRMPLGVPPKSMQWVRPGLNLNNRAPSIPAKRELPAEDRDRPYGSTPKAPKLESSTPASELQRSETSKPGSPSFVRPHVETSATGNRRASAEYRKIPSPKHEPLELRRLSNVSMVDAPPIPEKAPISATPSAAEVLQDSDDDSLELDEDDFAESEAKYNREKALLESKRIDLSKPHLRATTPLQEIMMLANLTADHLPRREVETIEEEAPPVPASEVPSQAPPEAVVNELPTPKDDETEDADMEDKEERQLAPATRALRLRRGTGDEREESPDLSSLPFLGSGPPTPISELEGPRVSDSIMLAIRDKLRKSIEPEMDVGDALDQYAATYRQWRIHLRSLDDVKDTDPHERAASAEPNVTTPDVQSATMGPILEIQPPTTGRRRHGWATELDLEKAIKESLKTAEKEREQHEKEPRRSMADPEKEADVPPELTAYEAQRRRFIDTNFQREPGQGIFVFHYEPPEDDFTEEEHRIMVQQYRDQYAKKWGKLAEILYKEAGTERTYKDCINHYYATKWGREYKGKVRRRGGRRPKNPGRGARAIANMERPDPSGDDGVPPALTETGRPRRSAAPTFGAETDLDTTASTPTPGRLRRQTDADTLEKPGRRGKAKEKTGRKAKPQTLAAAPAGSPVKGDRKALLGVKVEDDVNKLGELPLPLPSVIPDDQQSISADTQYQSSGFEQPRLPPGSRLGHSSYWSVNEQTDFRRNVAHFGTDWAAIANHMGTKTTVMVKNQYQRLMETGQAPDLERVAREADMRRERGEDLGVPPAPTPAPKRRNENTQIAVPRTLAPTPEAATVHPMPMPKASPPSSVPPSRFSTIAQAPQPSKSLAPGASYPMSDSSLVAIPQQQSPPAPPVPMRHGPRAGYFSEFPPRVESRPPSQSSNMPPNPRALQPQAQTHMRAHEQSQPPLFRPSSRQEREPPPEPEPRQDHSLRSYQEAHARLVAAEMHSSRHFRPTTEMGQMPSGQSAASPENRAIPLQQHRHVQQPPQERPVHPPSSLPPVQHMQSRPPTATLPVKEEPRHYPMPLHGQPQAQPQAQPQSQPQSQPHMQQPPTAHAQHQAYPPAPMPPTQAAPPPAPSVPKPAAEPRKSNLMSLLNDDQPEEPKKKKPVEQSIPSHTPTPQQQVPIAPPPPAVSQAMQQRRDPYAEAATQSSYGRPAYTQPGMPPVPARQVVDLTRDQSSGGRAQPREELTRPHPHHSQGQVAHNVISPHTSMSQPAYIPPYSERGVPLSNHRAFLAQHNVPRHNPSPPPMSAYNSPHLHSRTPSISAAQGQPPRHGMTTSGVSQHAPATGTSQILQPNPYAQVDPSGSSAQPSRPVGMQPSPHLHTSHVGYQRDLHSRNEQSQVHNGSLPYSNPQTPSDQHPAGHQHMRSHSIVDHHYHRTTIHRDLHHEYTPSDRNDHLRERESLMSRTGGPTAVHQDPRYPPAPQPQVQDRGGYASQRSHTPLARADHGTHPSLPPQLQHPPRSSLGESQGQLNIYGAPSHPPPPQVSRQDDRFRDPFAREGQAQAHAQREREEYHLAGQRERERDRDRMGYEIRERDRFGRGPQLPQAPTGGQQQGQQGQEQQRGSGMDWTPAVRREGWGGR